MQPVHGSGLVPAWPSARTDRTQQFRPSAALADRPIHAWRASSPLPFNEPTEPSAPRGADWPPSARREDGQDRVPVNALFAGRSNG